MPTCSSIPAAGALAILVAACGHPAPSPPPPRDPLTDADVVGYWSGEGGRLVLRARSGLILGAYDRDEGTLTARLEGATLVGWWCELPTRQADADAGWIELTFTGRGADRALAGRWREGRDGALHDDWALRFDPGEPPAELTERLDDPGLFCTQ